MFWLGGVFVCGLPRYPRCGDRCLPAMSVPNGRGAATDRVTVAPSSVFYAEVALGRAHRRAPVPRDIGGVPREAIVLWRMLLTVFAWTVDRIAPRQTDEEVAGYAADFRAPVEAYASYNMEGVAPHGILLDASVAGGRWLFARLRPSNPLAPVGVRRGERAFRGGGGDGPREMEAFYRSIGMTVVVIPAPVAAHAPVGARLGAASWGGHDGECYRWVAESTGGASSGAALWAVRESTGADM